MSGRGHRFPVADPDQAGFSPGGLARLAAVLEREVAEGTIPGAVALIARDGKIAFDRAFGMLDPAGAAPMRADALFRIFSMTKAITCTAALMLLEEGRLLLDEPVSRYIPAFADTPVAVLDGDALRQVPRQAELTLHHLFLHTGGLTHEIIPTPLQARYAAAGLARRGQTNAEHAEAVARLPLLAEPGVAWNYSRSIEVLGRVIEVIEGRPLGQVLAERIFIPLGMAETGFHATPADAAERLAQPFAADPWSGQPVRLFDMTERPVFEAGGGGLVSTAADYARFAQTILDRGALDGTRLLSGRTVRFMLSDHLDPAVTHRPDPLPAGYGFGLGFAVRTAAGRSASPGSVGQFFWNGAAGTQFFGDPAEGLWAILLVQAPGQRDRIRGLFRNLVYAALDG